LKEFPKGAQRALYFFAQALVTVSRGSMSKAMAGKARKGPKKAPSLPRKALKQVDLSVVREQITNLVGNSALDMVKTTMREVNNGHYLAMKYLFEMVGLCPATTPEATVQEDSLAKTLLRRLRLPEETNPSADVTKDSTPDGAEQESDAVK
jgi:hypothetical protein